MVRLIDDAISVGTIKRYVSDTILSGWLLCNGQAVSRVTFITLFSAIGTAYGNGDGVNTFNVPNLQDKFAKGKSVSGENLGAVGGCNKLIDHTHTSSLTAAGQGSGGHGHSVSISHTHGSSSVGGSINTSGSHQHTTTQSGTQHTGPGGYSSQTAASGSYTETSGAHGHGFSLTANAQSYTGSATSDACAHTHDSSSVSGSVGTGIVPSSTEARPHYQVVNYIIRY